MVVIRFLPPEIGQSRLVNEFRRGGFERAYQFRHGFEFAARGIGIAGWGIGIPWGTVATVPYAIIFPDNQNRMKMVRHDHKRIQYQIIILAMQPFPLILHDFPPGVQIHLALMDFAEHTAAILHANSDEVCPRRRIIIIRQTDFLSCGPWFHGLFSTRPLISCRSPEIDRSSFGANG